MHIKKVFCDFYTVYSGFIHKIRNIRSEESGYMRFFASCPVRISSIHVPYLLQAEVHGKLRTGYGTGVEDGAALEFL